MSPRFQLPERMARSAKQRHSRRPAREAPAARRETDQRDQTGTAALLFATTATTDGGPAAALRVLGTTVLTRLLGQLESLGVGPVWIVTRPAWNAIVEEAVTESGFDATVVSSDNLGNDLRLTAEIAGGNPSPLLIGNAHLLAHREALVGLLVDPRAGSGVLMTASPLKAHWSFAFHSLRGRLISAESPYHRIERESGYFLGILKVDVRDRDRLVNVSRELARLAAQRPKRWDEELERKVAHWRVRAWRAAVERETGVAPNPAEAPDPGTLRFDDETEKNIALRRRVSTEDPVPLLLVGLVRREVELWPSPVRQFFHATPLSPEDAERAAEELSRADEARLLLDSAVKASDGFFTTYFVSPYSKYLARFAARRGWTPNAITAISLAIGVGAAAAFAVGSRASLIAGAVLLQISFTVDCVDGQLARYTRTFSTLGGWLDSVFDRTKEYLVYAGLAVGSARGFGDHVWVLAAAALTLQTARHMSDFAYVATQRRVVAAKPALPLDQPEDRSSRRVDDGLGRRTRAAAMADASPSRRLALTALGAYRLLRRSRLLQWGNRIIRLPIGERFALISLTAAIATPRATFVALLVWGGVGAVYALFVRTLVSYGVPRRLVQAVLE
jgi:phosphatidylglycerophosphate synthase